MYVCHCRAVNDRTVQTAALAGARTIDELTALCGAGGDCGGCHLLLEELLAASKSFSEENRVPELVG